MLDAAQEGRYPGMKPCKKIITACASTGVNVTAMEFNEVRELVFRHEYLESPRL